MSRKRVSAPREHRKVIMRDVMIFQLKLFLDGVKDIVLSPLSIIAAVADVVAPTDRVGKRFYHVMLIGERIDRWLNLFGAAEHADPGEDGLFGTSRAGSNTMLGKLETIVTGRVETEPAPTAAKPEFDDHPLDWEPRQKSRDDMAKFDEELSGTGELSREEMNHDIFGQPDP